MGVDVELQVPVGLILIPLAVVGAFFYLRSFSFQDWFKKAGEEWTEEAQKTHLISVVEFDEMQVEQAGLTPITAGIDTDETLLQHGNYAVTATGQVIGL